MLQLRLESEASGIPLAFYFNIMIDKNIIDKLKQKYSHINPLMFHRSVERAKSAGDLFDILDTMPVQFPIVWDEEKHCWVSTKDLFQSQFFLDRKD